MIEDLYRRRYESSSDGQNSGRSLLSHVGYKDSLKELYTRILKFQAAATCYYSKNSAFRAGLDIVQWDSWDSLFEDIKKQETVFWTTNNLWNDKTYQEEFEATHERHREQMKSLNCITSDLSGLRKAIEDTQRDKQRQELLDWLSQVDPSINYNSALGKLEAPQTGTWLLQDDGFKEWELSQNSIVWLHGKGMGNSSLP